MGEALDQAHFVKWGGSWRITASPEILYPGNRVIIRKRDNTARVVMVGKVTEVGSEGSGMLIATFTADDRAPRFLSNAAHVS
jgi:hypothetical protein